MHLHQRFDDFSSAYLETLRQLVHEPDFASGPRGMKTHELINWSFSVTDTSNTKINWANTGAPERGLVVEAYHAKELSWYLSGSLKASEAPSKFWLKLQDAQGNVTSNYGYMVLYRKTYPTSETGLEHVIRVLQEDPDSRQAIMHYGTPENFWAGNKDIPCTVSNQFLLRDGLLHMIVNMRSNDVTKGLPYDFPWMQFVQMSVADGVNAKPGSIFWNAGSMHLYEKDLELARQILG
jgi:thymidylate synthase